MPRTGAAATREAHKALVRRFVEEAINRGNPEVVPEVWAARAGRLSAGVATAQRVRELVLLYHEAVPDAHWTIEQQVAEGDVLVTRFTARGTHRGALLGLAPSGKPLAVPGILISRWEAHKIALQWAQADLLGLVQQLGVMPDLALDRAVVVARVLQAGALGAASPERPAPPGAPR